MEVGPASFPIISIEKLARKRVLLEFSTLPDGYWRLPTETFETYTQHAAENFVDFKCTVISFLLVMNNLTLIC